MNIDVFRDHIQNDIKDHMAFNMNTASICKITSVAKLGTGLISVKPMVNHSYSDGKYQEIPEIEDVPVVFPSGGGGSLTFPLAVGDMVLVVYSDRSLDEWSATGDLVQTIDPADPRMFNSDDAIAIPSLKAVQSGINTTSVVLSYKGSLVKIDDSGAVSIEGASTVSISGADTIAIDGGASVSISAADDLTLSVGGNINISAGGNITMSASNIDLN